jgi:hypothetical protein
MSEDRRLLKEFLADFSSNKWVSFAGLDAYLRKSTRQVNGKLVPVFDIATVVGVPPYGRGRFSEWHAEVERVLVGTKFKHLMLECVHNPIIGDFALRHGYRPYGADSYLKEIDEDHQPGSTGVLHA